MKESSRNAHSVEKESDSDGYSSGVHRIRKLDPTPGPDDVDGPSRVGPTSVSRAKSESLWFQVTRGIWKVRPCPDQHGTFVLQRVEALELPQWQERELRLAAILLQGKNNAQVGEALNISEATACRWINYLLLRIGLSLTTMVVCMRVFSWIRAPVERWCCLQIKPQGPTSWSAAERDICHLSLAGLCVCEIATLRNKSPITVRKQLRAGVHKARCIDKLELAASVELAFEFVRDPET